MGLAQNKFELTPLFSILDRHVDTVVYCWDFAVYWAGGCP